MGQQGAIHSAVRDRLASHAIVDPVDRCGDADGDGCSDCANGPVDPANDGPDLDGDGLCDLGDPDDDNDGMDDGADTDPRNPAVCGDSDGDLCEDCVHGSLNPGEDGADLDGDGLCDLGDPDDDGDGLDDGVDPDPRDPAACGDSDGDLCDDCAQGSRNPGEDGADFDDDGQCDLGDPDDDNDGVADVDDDDDFNANVCGDSDADTCDDCASGSFDVAHDGPDADGDGICNAGDPDCGDNGDECVAVVPDPVDVAPELPATEITAMHSATSFLYEGFDAVQTGVEPDTIEEARVVVIRGTVSDRAGDPLAGVTVTILDHPELGQTATRPDGHFDMAANGGGQVTLSYSGAGYLPIQRSVEVPWREYVWAPDVVLTPVDEHVTTVSLGAGGEMQVARGSVVNDEDGSRQGTLLFEAGTEATMQLPDGSTQVLDSANVRLTEYTVGSAGPAAMPGVLPPTSGYTYAVELSVDEALAAGADEVTFDRPVVFYVDNFIDAPTGSIVPVGWYSRRAAAWVPSENGLVVEMLGIDGGGLAELDVDGSGMVAGAAALATLGISSEEQQRLATLYPDAPFPTLWRVAVTHFTPFDLNWPYGPRPDAIGPPVPKEVNEIPDEPDCESGSIIQCQGQVLGESVAIAGTPLKLVYRSDRAEGYAGARELPIVVAGSNPLPNSLRRIEVTVTVAGQKFNRRFEPVPDQAMLYRWDGRDGYGRRVVGRQKARVTIRYVYPGVIMEPAERVRAFGQISGTAGAWIGGSRAAAEIFIDRSRTQWLTPGTLSGVGSPSDLGGWTLNVHHGYDFESRVFETGGGTRRFAGNALKVVERRLGSPDNECAFIHTHCDDDGIRAVDAYVSRVYGLAWSPDGQLYVSDFSTRVDRIDAQGLYWHAVGRRSSLDGPSPVEANFYSVGAIAFGPSGDLFICDTRHYKIVRVDTDGVLSTVVGTGQNGYTGDGGPATEAKIGWVNAIDIGPDGTIWLTESNAHAIRRVTPDGIISTYAGTGDQGFSAAIRQQNLHISRRELVSTRVHAC